jgi:hypothetical protein
LALDSSSATLSLSLSLSEDCISSASSR